MPAERLSRGGDGWKISSVREVSIGAGSIIARLPGRKSPEAELAAAAFERFRASLPSALRECGSGKELIARGFAEDAELAAQRPDH
jgi:2-phosphosulfolactate phosphatase